MTGRLVTLVSVLSFALACDDSVSLPVEAITLDAAPMPVIDATSTDGPLGSSVDAEGLDPDMATGSSDAAPTVDALTTPDVSAPDAAILVDAAPGDPDLGPQTFDDCFGRQFVNAPEIGPDYDQFEPTYGRHCLGTNHQRIEGVERVVFVGDSVSVGTPPTDPSQFYRVRLAQQLSAHFDLTPPDILWYQVNFLNSRCLTQDSGDFSCCARYGARTDDLMVDNGLMTECVPEAQRQKKTLFIITMGGNDISSLTQNGIDGASPEDLWVQTETFVQHMRDAIRWATSPGRFPNGVYVVFANMFEFTDGTGDVTACPAAGLAGFGNPWDDPALLTELVIWANEQFMSIAHETGTDMIFMLEHFCGHGFNADNPESPCYRGPGSENWFDLTCIHPSPAGHAEIARQFMSVVRE